MYIIVAKNTGKLKWLTWCEEKLYSQPSLDKDFLEPELPFSEAFVSVKICITLKRQFDKDEQWF